ncbi:intradiol ring-cleavage dioxygenase [Streptomyces cylindrosporus]|uniref:Intradiol ring-cleavage dioxygenase n=1 Tax=Streptomyces cylindrosporus TaxID=2927583 RepID=A0ABS9YC92_9ACTN|nr:intradiol ring-cleavage dioxygenase [Streptomyces cylindrosporus]MCI3274815.1 intradiol ring-cleavage dioxygenase [Streptomyces cylindrosporus]
MTDTQTPEERRELARRTVLAAGGVVVTAVGVGGAFVAGAQASEQENACYTLTSELVEGPYYIDADKIRQDVTEDQEGIPLHLRLKVIDAETCRPVRNAAVDIWHCNATGVYSGYEEMGSGGGGGGPTGPPPSGTPTGTPTGSPPPGGGGGHQEPTDDERYLRGTWRTDRHGYVGFRTVFPGWYQGRCVHIHVKVHVDGTWTDAGYEGGHTCHTGQLFFDEKSVLASAAVEPYASNTTTRTTLDEDTIYPGNGHAGGLLYLEYDHRHIARGVHAHLTLGVAPDETNDG